MELIYKVQKVSNYKTIRHVLKNEFNISNNLITKLKKSKQIFLNDKFTYIDHLLCVGDEVKVILDLDENSDNIVPNDKIGLEILFEDDSLLIINKQASITSHPSMNHYDNSLANGVKYYLEKTNQNNMIRLVNRLDKDTSGVIIFAKNQYIQEALIKQMKENIFKKEYIAILEGALEKNSGTINAPIARKPNSIIEREINNNGDISITHYELIKILNIENKTYSLVNFKLETGRTHQIRVHTKYINHPIIGDTLYNKESNLISRQALHAFKTNFIHPITKMALEIIAPIPNDIENIIKKDM